jgi:hypothetical protein
MYKSKTAVINFFKNTEISDFKFNHHSAWERRLKEELFYRNYIGK